MEGPVFCSKGDILGPFLAQSKADFALDKFNGLGIFIDTWVVISVDVATGLISSKIRQCSALVLLSTNHGHVGRRKNRV